jgi:hypothetical protein
MGRPTLLPSRRRAAIFCLVGAGIAARTTPARASDSVTAEAGGGVSKPTPILPSTPQEYQRVVGRLEPNDSLYLSAQVRLTRDFPNGPAPGTTLATGGDWIWFGSLDGSVDLTDDLTVGFDLNGQAPSSRDVASPFTYPTSRTTSQDTTALMKATTYSVGGAFDISYDTFDDNGPPHALDETVDVSVAYNHYGVDQSMTALDGPNGATTVGNLVASCAGKTTALCSSAGFAAHDISAGLEQARFGATLTTTVAENTDLTLDGGYYVYNRGDPDAVGFYDFTVFNAAGQSLGTGSFGAGLPLLPPRWQLRPEIARRWSALTVDAWYQFTDYTSPEFLGHAVGGKVQLRLGKTWRIYTTGSYRVDVSSVTPDDTAHSFTLGLGVTYAF